MTKILIIRFSSIGDILLTTPVIRCLKKQVPDSEIHFLTKPGYGNILECNPYIDKIHTLDKSLFEKALELRKIGFDQVVDLHNNLRTLVLKRIMNVHSSSYNKLNIEKWLMVRFQYSILPPVHIVDRYMDAVSHLGVVNDEEGLDYFLPEDIAPVIAEHYTAFAIGGQYYTKKLPVEKIIEICRDLKAPVVLLGGEEDKSQGDLIVASAGPHVKNLAGSLTLHQSAYVIREADRVITHDTGLMHIAAAFKKEIFSVWGNTIPAFGMEPYFGNKNNSKELQSKKMEVLGLDCRPCSKIGFSECPRGHFKCMIDQDVQELIRIINNE